MKRLVLAIVIGCAMLGSTWEGVHAAGRVPAPGHVLFGWGINHHTLGVIHPLWTARRGSHIWMAVNFGQAVGVQVRFSIARELGGGTERFVGATTVTLPSPTDTRYANSLHVILWPGWYRMEFIRGSSLIAEGPLHVVR